MNRFSFLIPLLFIFLLSGCSAISVNYDYDNSVDFSTIHTYGWGQLNGPDDALAKEPLLKKRIIATIDRYLESRGYRKVDPAQADVLIVIQAGVEEKMRVTDRGVPRDYYHVPWYDPWWGRGAYGSRVDITYYKEGTLVVDIVDNAKKELIWRGLGTGIVHRYTDQEKLQTTVDEYVQDIPNHFPAGNEKIKK